METLSASDTRRVFGEVILKAQQGPLRINKNGKPVAVMISATAYAEIENMNRKFLQLAIDKGLEDVKEGRVYDGSETLARLKKRANDNRI
jgi:prevent-host-death family protein